MVFPVFLLFFCWPFSLKKAGGLGRPRKEPTTKISAEETGLKLTVWTDLTIFQAFIEEGLRQFPDL